MSAPLNLRQFDSAAEDVLGALGGTSMRPHHDNMSHEELQDHWYHDHKDGLVTSKTNTLRVLHEEDHIEKNGHEDAVAWMKAGGVKTVPGWRDLSWKTHRHG